MPAADPRSLVSGLMGDGRPLLSLTGTALILSGGFGILQSVSGFLLPHDSAAIGMDAATLSHLGNRPLLHFMFHDRTAYCGTLLAVGSAYWWLAEFPLNAGCEWAWWAYAISGLTGFLSFLAYLQYGYLDTWHACATLLLLPTFFVGLVRSRACFSGPISIRHAWLKPTPGEPPAAKWGRLLLEACAAGLVLAGLTIIAVGMTIVFVPQDFHFIQLSREQLQAISPMLIPVIAHDRSGFGGSVLWLVVREMLILLGGGLGLLSAGLLIGLIVRNAALTRSFVELIALMGFFGFGAALGVHVAIGYLDFTHLAPAYGGLLLYLAGLVLCTSGLLHRGKTEDSIREEQAGSKRHVPVGDHN